MYKNLKMLPIKPRHKTCMRPHNNKKVEIRQWKRMEDKTQNKTFVQLTRVRYLNVSDLGDQTETEEVGEYFWYVIDNRCHAKQCWRATEVL